MSDTPMTDAAEYRQPDTDPAEPLGMVDVEFARQLERELAAANETVKKLEAWCAGMEEMLTYEGWESTFQNEFKKYKEATL